jgi:hypothetical protein
MKKENFEGADADKPPKRLLIHAGYHKTGTSFLQKNLFIDQNAGYCSPIDRIYLRNTFIRTNPFEFDSAKVREEFMPDINKALEKCLIAVLSHEQFSGQPAGSGYGVRRRQREISRKEIVNRLYACFPEARVLIVIREQREMIKSIYKFFVLGWKSKLSANIEQFLDQSMLDNGYGPLFHLDYLRYDHIISHYQSLYGVANVKVLPYEWLRDEPLEFINQINRFAGNNIVETVSAEKVNEGYSASLCTLKRYLNRMLASPDKPGKYSKAERRAAALIKRLNRHVPKSVHERAEKKLSEKITELTDGAFTESNKRTANLTGLDLAALGYEMS